MTTPPLTSSPPRAEPVVSGRITLRVVTLIWITSFALTVATFGRSSDLFLYSIAVALLGAVLLVLLPGLLFVVHAFRHRATAAATDVRRFGIGSGAAIVVLGVILSLGGVTLAVCVALWGLGTLIAVRAWAMSRSGASAPVRGALAHLASTVAALVSVPLLLRMSSLSGGTKEKAYIAAMQYDLHTLVTAQEAFRADSGRYGNEQELYDFFASSGDYITVTLAPDRKGWWATTLDYRTTTRCGIWIGAKPRDGMHGAKEGVARCWEVR